MTTGSWDRSPGRTVPDILRAHAHEEPSAPILEVDGVECSASELEESSNRVARGMLARGVEPRDRVATFLENRMPTIVNWFATMKTGAIPVPINTAYRGEFLRHQLRDSGARWIVADADHLGSISRALADLRTIERCVIVGDGEDEELPVPHLSWEELDQGPSGFPDVALDPRSPASIIYTSGTTGPSKGCVLSHNHIVGRSQRVNGVWDRTSADVLWTPLPLFHINALEFAVVGSLMHGSRGVISRRFSLSGFWSEVVSASATIGSLLASMATLVARAEGREGEEAEHRLRMVQAVPMPPAVDRAWRERFGVQTFSGMYGQTEAAPLSLLLPGEENRAGAAGKPNGLDFDVRIFDERDHEVPAGEVGEIVCRPRWPQAMFDGYWNNPSATRAASRNWWFHTGDLGRVDEDGYLYFVDRYQDYIRRRGENISSNEVEQTFLQHDAIEDVAVHAVPSELGEDDVKVTAVLRPGASLTEAQLCEWAAAELPFFAVPRYIEFRGELPRSPVGRVLKRVLRDDGVTPSTWDREAASASVDG